MARKAVFDIKVLGEAVGFAPPDYTAHLTRDEDDPNVWEAHIPNVDGEPDEIFTYGRNVREAIASAQEALTLALDLDDDGDPTPTIAVTVGDEPQNYAMYCNARSMQSSLHTYVGEQTKLLAKRLVTVQGMSAADAGMILGVTGQRVSQLINSD